MKMISNLHEAHVVQGVILFHKKNLLHSGLCNFSPVALSRTHQCLHRGRALAGFPEILVAGSLLDLHFLQSQALSSPMLWRKICPYSPVQKLLDS